MPVGTAPAPHVERIFPPGISHKCLQVFPVQMDSSTTRGRTAGLGLLPAMGCAPEPRGAKNTLSGYSELGRGADPPAALAQPLLLPPTFRCLSSPAPKSISNGPCCSPGYRHGGSSGVPGSAEPGWPRATCGGAGGTRTSAGQELGYAITVRGYL